MFNHATKDKDFKKITRLLELFFFFLKKKEGKKKKPILVAS